MLELVYSIITGLFLTMVFLVSVLIFLDECGIVIGEDNTDKQ